SPRALRADGPAAVVVVRQRPHLRDPRSGGRARLRALVRRGHDERLLDPWPAPLDSPHRRLRLLLPRGLGGPSLLRIAPRRPLLRLRVERPGALELRERRPDLGLAGGRRRRRLLQQSSKRDLRPRLALGAEGAAVPRRSVRGRLRQRGPAPPARLLAALCCRASSSVSKRVKYTAAGV